MPSSPNFFIIGAPKCGTTSLAFWLGSHRDIFVTRPKEPHFFSSDIPVIAAIRDESRYAELFAQTTHLHKAVGEASTSYLRSRVAVQTIRHSFPEAKFIVCLRNPIDMVVSAHMQLVKGGREPERSLSVAWEKQESRMKGVDLPKYEDPEAFQYGSLCLLGEQMERLFRIVPQSDVHVILLDEMKEDARKVYRNVLQFLGVQDDERTSFPVLNSRREPRFYLFGRIVYWLHVWKVRIGIRTNTGLGNAISFWSNGMPSNDPIPPELTTKLREYFKEDIVKLEGLLGRSFRDWLR